jgi:hypothetical protein
MALPSEPPSISPALHDLVMFAIQAALTSIKRGGPMIPFVSYEHEGKGRRMQPFVTDLEQADGDADPTFDLGASAEAAQAFARSLAGQADRAVIVIDAKVTDGKGQARDCVLLEAFELGMTHAQQFVQRYQRAQIDRQGRIHQRLVAIGQPMIGEQLDPLW